VFLADDIDLNNLSWPAVVVIVAFLAFLGWFIYCITKN
jgi:hypothetical protein